MTDITLPTNHRFVNITGNRYGRLVVVSYLGKKGKSHLWNCRCDCGQEKIIYANNLKKGDSKSCGCLQKEIVSIKNTTHGMTETPMYDVWQSMKWRCVNPENHNYKHYGGRGITVCERWLHSFENFFADMGLRPSPELSIDRIDNNGNYELSNCRWATKGEQNSNTRRNNKVATNKEQKV